VAAALIFMGFTLAMPFLPYFIADLGVAPSQVGLWSGVTLSLAPLLAALLGPVWGKMSDRFGLRIMAQRTLLAMTLHWVLMFFVDGLGHLLALRIFLGVFSGFGAISMALITQGVPREQIGRVVGTLQATQIFSAALGPLLGGLLYDWVGLRPTFALTALVCLLGFLMVSAFYRDIPREEEGVSDGTRESGEGEKSLGLAQILRLPGVLPLMVLLFVALSVSRSLGVLIPLHVRALVGDVANLGQLNGLTLSSGYFAEGVAAYACGRVLARVRPKLLLLVCLLGAGLLVSPLGLMGSVAAVVGLRAGGGLLSGGVQTLGYSMGGARFPERYRATCYSFLGSAALLGAASGPLVGGALSDAIGLRGTFMAAGGAYLLLALLTALSLRREMRLRPPRAPERPASVPPPR